jgi:hypothetical protein
MLRSVVLMDETAESITAADVAAGRLFDLCRLGRLKRKSAVGALAVVVVDVDPQDVASRSTQRAPSPS